MALFAEFSWLTCLHSFILCDVEKCSTSKLLVKYMTERSHIPPSHLSPPSPLLTLFPGGGFPGLIFDFHRRLFVLGVVIPTYDPSTQEMEVGGAITVLGGWPGLLGEFQVIPG